MKRTPSAPNYRSLSTITRTEIFRYISAYYIDFLLEQFLRTLDNGLLCRNISTLIYPFVFVNNISVGKLLNFIVFYKFMNCLPPGPLPLSLLFSFRKLVGNDNTI